MFVLLSGWKNTDHKSSMIWFRTKIFSAPVSFGKMTPRLYQSGSTSFSQQTKHKHNEGGSVAGSYLSNLSPVSCTEFCIPESSFHNLFSLYSVQRFISEDKLPHLLFYGPPGTGKTSTILACARQLYKDNDFNSMVLEVGCSSSLAAACEAIPAPVQCPPWLDTNFDVFQLLFYS